MTKFIKLFLATLLLASCSPKEENNQAEAGILIISTSTGDIVYEVENARTPEELEVGLMNRTSLGENAGMIFDLSHVSNKVAMWMKDTKISLDMLFVKPDGQIFWIFENAVPMSEEFIIAPEPAAAVVEINAGDAKKNNIQIGDTIRHEFFNNMNLKTDENKLPPRQEQVKTPAGTQIESENNETTVTPSDASENIVNEIVPEVPANEIQAAQ